MDKLKHISPSQFVNWHDCPYRAIMSKTNSYVPNANAALGTLIRRFYEKYKEWHINSEDAFLRKCDEEIDALNQANLLVENFYPIQWHSIFYIVKRNLLKRRVLTARQIQIEASAKDSVFLYEKWISNDCIGGYADLIVKKDNIITSIVDYKTGKVYDRRTGDIKNEYKAQLALYCSIILATQNHVPKMLLETIDGQYHEIKLERDVISNYAQRARELFKTINDAIEQDDTESLAVCNEDNCRWCIFKKKCILYSQNSKRSQDTDEER